MKNTKKLIGVIIVAAILVMFGAYIIANWQELFNGGSEYLHNQIGAGGDAYQLPATTTS